MDGGGRARARLAHRRQAAILQLERHRVVALVGRRARPPRAGSRASQSVRGHRGVPHRRRLADRHHSHRLATAHLDLQVVGPDLVPAHRRANQSRHRQPLADLEEVAPTSAQRPTVVLVDQPAGARVGEDQALAEHPGGLVGRRVARPGPQGVGEQGAKDRAVAGRAVCSVRNIDSRPRVVRVNRLHPEQHHRHAVISRARELLAALDRAAHRLDRITVHRDDVGAQRGGLLENVARAAVRLAVQRTDHPVGRAVDNTVQRGKMHRQRRAVAVLRRVGAQDHAGHWSLPLR